MSFPKDGKDHLEGVDVNDVRILSQSFVDDGTAVKYMVTKESEIKTWQFIYKIAEMTLE